MAISVIEKKVSENRKRIDAHLKVTSFFNDPWELKIRILGYEPIKEEDEEEIFETVIQKRKAWKQNKKNQSLSLASYNATAFILKTEAHEPSTED